MTDTDSPGVVVPIFDGAAGHAIEDLIRLEVEALTTHWAPDDRLDAVLRDLKHTLGII